MKKGLGSIKLAELVSITHGFAFKSQDFKVDAQSENPIVLTPGNFAEDSTLMFTSKNTKRCHGIYQKDYLFEIGELVMVMTDLSSKMKILGKSSFIRIDNILHNQRIGRVIPKTDMIDLGYLYYYFQTEAYLNKIRLTATGTMVRHTSPKRILDNEIHLPPRPEQQQIVAILDKAFAAIDKAKANIERNLQNAKELFQSELNQIFSQKGEGWEEKKLQEVCVLQRGFDLPKRLRVKGQYPLVSSSGISDTHKDNKVKAPGVVTGRSGSIGNVFYITEDFWPLNTVLYIKEFHENNERLIYYLLRHFDLEKYSTGTGVPTLNRNFVHDELVNIPSTKEKQIEIVEKLDQLEIQTKKLEKYYLKKTEELNELKKSILQKAFAGELTDSEYKITEIEQLDMVAEVKNNYN